MKKENHNWSGEYEKSYSGSSYNKEERSHDTGRKVESKPSVDQGRNVPPRTQSTPMRTSKMIPNLFPIMMPPMMIRIFPPLMLLNASITPKFPLPFGKQNKDIKVR